MVLGADVINVDEASYVVAAREWLQAHLPYTAFGDNKPPLIYAYFALTETFFGGGVLGARLLTNFITIPLTALAISRFYDHDRRGLAGALAFLVFGAAYDANDMLAVNCELIMMLPLAWAAVLVRDRASARLPHHRLWAGLLVSTASLVKYQAFFWAGPILVATVYDTWAADPRRAFRDAATFAASLLLPWTVTVAAFAAANGFEGFYYWNVTHNVTYLQNPVTVADALSRGVRKLGPFLIVTSPLWVAWWRSAREQATPYWNTLVAGVTLASLATTFLGWRFFPHYFVALYVPLALGAAPWLAHIVSGPSRAPRWALAALAVALLAGFTTLNVRRYVVSSPRVVSLSQSVSARLREDPCFGQGPMFVWGSAPVFYYHADLPIASRFFFPEFPLVRYYAGNPSATTAREPRVRNRDRRARHWRWLMNDLAENQPTFILDTAPGRVSLWQLFPMSNYPQLERFVNRHYEIVDSIEGVDIYRQRGCLPVARAN